jgi:hypothetical protein
MQAEEFSMLVELENHSFKLFMDQIPWPSQSDRIKLSVITPFDPSDICTD